MEKALDNILKQIEDNEKAFTKKVQGGVESARLANDA